VDSSFGALDAILSAADEEFEGEVRARVAGAGAGGKGEAGEREGLGEAELACREWTAAEDEGVSCAAFKDGRWTFFCNDRFTSMFLSAAELEERVQQSGAVPSFFYGR
jgi:hypothetical protein